MTADVLRASLLEEVGGKGKSVGVFYSTIHFQFITTNFHFTDPVGGYVQLKAERSSLVVRAIPFRAEFLSAVAC